MKAAAWLRKMKSAWQSLKKNISASAWQRWRLASSGNAGSASEKRRRGENGEMAAASEIAASVAKYHLAKWQISVWRRQLWRSCIEIIAKSWRHLEAWREK
jgi:hypothetical protein